MLPEPYTYYKNDKEGRAFLLVSCPTEMHPNEPVILLEWGKSRDEGLRLPIEKFTGLVKKGLMKRFTPIFQP